MAQSNSYLIKFGADATSVTKAISSINGDMKALGASARAAEQNFKFTGDTAQLNKAIAATMKQIEGGEAKVALYKKQLDSLRDSSGELPDTVAVQKLNNQILTGEANVTKLNTKLAQLQSADAGDDIASGMSKAEKSIDAAENATGKLHQGLTKSGVALGSFVGNLAGNLVSGGIQAIGGIFAGMTGDIIDASDSLDKFKQTMSFAGKSDKEIAAVTASSKKYADQTVYDLNTVLNTTAQLGANGVKNYDQLVQASGNLNAVVGGNADTFQSVSMVLTQTAGAGKLTTDNWNQLSDAIPGASGKLQEALKKNGAFTGNFRDALEKGQISADEFNKAIMQLGMTDTAKKAATSTKTIEGAIGNLQASFVSVGNDLLNGIKQPLTDAISFIANTVPQIQGMIGGMFKGLSSDTTIGSLGGVFQSLFDSIKGVDLSGIIGQFQSIGTTISNVFSNLDFSGLQNLVSQIIPAVVAGFGSFMNVAKPAIDGVVTAFGNFWNAIQPIISAIGDMLVPAFKILGGYLGGFFSGVMSVVSTLFNGLAKAAEFLTPAIQWVSGVFQSLAPVFQMISTWIGKLQGSFSAMSGIFSTVGKIFGSVGGSIGNAFSAMGSKLSGIFNSVKSAFTGVGNTMRSIGGSIGQIPAQIVRFFSGIGGKIAAPFSSVKSLVVGKFGGIGSAIFNAFGNVGSIGLNVVKGIARGITSGLGFIKGVISSFVGNTVSFIKKLFKIHSPSRLMRDEVGTFITQGIAVGMVDNKAMTAIDKSATGVTSGVLNSFTGLNNPAINGSLTTTGAFSTGGVGSTSNTNNSLVFNVSGADPNKNAEAIRKVLRQEGLV